MKPNLGQVLSGVAGLGLVLSGCQSRPDSTPVPTQEPTAIISPTPYPTATYISPTPYPTAIPLEVNPIPNGSERITREELLQFLSAKFGSEFASKLSNLRDKDLINGYIDISRIDSKIGWDESRILRTKLSEIINNSVPDGLIFIDDAQNYIGSNLVNDPSINVEVSVNPNTLLTVDLHNNHDKAVVVKFNQEGTNSEIQLGILTFPDGQAFNWYEKKTATGSSGQGTYFSNQPAFSLVYFKTENGIEAILADMQYVNGVPALALYNLGE